VSIGILQDTHRPILNGKDRSTTARTVTFINTDTPLFTWQFSRKVTEDEITYTEHTGCDKLTSFFI
jgi:hypothetical protein